MWSAAATEVESFGTGGLPRITDLKGRRLYLTHVLRRTLVKMSGRAPRNRPGTGAVSPPHPTALARAIRTHPGALGSNLGRRANGYKRPALDVVHEAVQIPPQVKRLNAVATRWVKRGGSLVTFRAHGPPRKGGGLAAAAGLVPRAVASRSQLVQGGDFRQRRNLVVPV